MKVLCFLVEIVAHFLTLFYGLSAGAKLRVRLLKLLKYLTLGFTIASSSDLQELFKLSRELHLLLHDDLNVHDKMNYDAVERLCQPHIRELLRKHVPG